jgi:hypothetical protein
MAGSPTLSEPLLEPAGGTSSRGPESPVEQEPPVTAQPKRSGLRRLKWLFAWCGGTAAGAPTAEHKSRRHHRHRRRSGRAPRAGGDGGALRAQHSGRRQQGGGAVTPSLKAPSIGSRGEPAFASILSGED